MPYIKGKWKWQKSFKDRDYQVQCQCSFVSNGETFYGIGFGYDSHNGCYMLEYERSEGSATAGSSYQDETTCYMFDDYRIIDFGDTEQYIDRMLHEFILDHAEPYFTIPEKLETIASNEQKVHKAGYDLGHDKGYDEGLDVGYQNGFEEGKNAGGYDQGFADGKQAEYDAFWDAYQQNGNLTIYENVFGGKGWNNETFKPKYTIKPNYAYNMFYACAVTDGWEYIKDMDFSQCTFVNQAFSQCYFKHIGTLDCRKADTVNSLFYHARALQTVDKLIVKESQTLVNAFTNIPTLENITFEGVIGQSIDMAGVYSGNANTKLTRASIESIVNHLSDTATGKTLTLSKTAADTAFPCWLDGVNYGCGGNGEWIELVATKSNWQISLV